MNVAGIDIGGTKIEAQVFDADWTLRETRRVPTPDSYDELLAAIRDQIGWIRSQSGTVPVGLSVAGLMNPATGLTLAANLPASGQPFAQDLRALTDGPITILNDCRAFALSEALLGAGRGHSTSVGLIIGTGIGGGIIRDGRLGPNASGTMGEFGHLPAPAHVIQRHGLPVLPCGCGRTGCIETLASGRGMERLALALIGSILTAPEIAAGRATDPLLAGIWSVWIDLMAELLQAITLTIDPDIIVLGGGLSRVPGVERDLAAALATTQFATFTVPRIALAAGGDASGARGAALAALQDRTA